MSRVNRRTKPSGCSRMVDKDGLPLRPRLGKTRRFALHKVNPPGTKMAKKILKHLGLYRKET